MSKGKSTWKYNKLLTARRNMFVWGGNPSNNPGMQRLQPTDMSLQPIAGGFNANDWAPKIDSSTPTLSDNSSASTGNSSAGMASSIAALAGTAAKHLGTMVSNIKSTDVKNTANSMKDNILSTTNSAKNITSFDDLNQAFLNNVDTRHITKDQLGYKGTLGVGTEALTAGLEGSSAGFGLGPVGAIVGGVMGTGTSLIGNLFRNSKIKQETNKLNDIIDYTNAFKKNNLVNSLYNTIGNQYSAMNSTYNALGGPLHTNGGVFGNGLIYIDNGNSHEENPLGGVPISYDQEGTPNLVEEGETIFNDYVFSNRLLVPTDLKKKYKLGGKVVSFADASKKLAQESEERPNDPISMRGLQVLMSELSNAQEQLKEEKRRNSFALGGKVNKFAGDPWTPSKINTYGYIKDGYYGLGDTPFWIKDGKYTDEYTDFIKNKYGINEFRQHLKDQFDFYDKASDSDKKTNRYKAIKMFIDSNPEWYANRNSIDTWNIDDNLLKQARTYAQSKPGFMHPETVVARALGEKAAIPANQEYGVTLPQVDITPEELQELYRYYYNTGTKDKPNYVLYEGDNAPLWMKNNRYRYTSSNANPDPKIKGMDYYYDAPEELKLGRNKSEFLRYAPAVGFGIGAITDALGWTNNPDYGNADALLEASKDAGIYQPVSFNPIGNYLKPRIFDRNYYLNNMYAQANASRQAMLNTTGRNRATAMAGITALNNNTLNQMGVLARQGEEFNANQEIQRETFNRDTDKFNSEEFLSADTANQKASLSARGESLRGTMAAYQMREAEKNRVAANKSANLSGLLTSLGDIGYDALNDNMVRRGLETGIWGAGAHRVYMGAEGGNLVKKNKRTNKKRGLTI